MIVDAAVELLRREVPGLVAVYLFGSHARGAARAGSDVDLALLAPAPLGPHRRWELQGALADYARLNEERREILRRAAAEGRIHAR